MSGRRGARNALHFAQVLQMGLNEGPSGPSFGFPEKRYTEVERTPAIPVSIIAAGAILGVSAWWYSRRGL